MSTLKINTLSNLAGSQSTPVENAINGSAKAWVNFNGTGTVAIRTAYNVSSITDRGAGKYTVNYAATFADASGNVIVAGDVDDTEGNSRIYNIEMSSRTNTSVSLATYSNSDFEDYAFISLAVFR